MEGELIKGVVKAFDAGKGYGWLGTDTSPDVFFHHTNVDGPVPPVGTKVMFEHGTNPRDGRSCAINVRAVDAVGGLDWIRGKMAPEIAFLEMTEEQRESVLAEMEAGDDGAH
jgi:cold shock CspA family protein